MSEIMAAGTKVDRAQTTYEHMKEGLVSRGFKPEPVQVHLGYKAVCTACETYLHEVLPGHDKPVSPGDREAGRTYAAALVRICLLKPLFRTPHAIEVDYQGFPPLAEPERLHGQFNASGNPANENAQKLCQMLFPTLSSN